MKKTLSMVILFIIVALLATTFVNAATTADSVEAIYAIGSKYGMTSADKIKLERFIKDNGVTEAQTSTLLSKAQEAEKIMKSAGVTDYTKLTTEQKNELKTLANQAASAVGVSLTFKKGTVEVYKDGKLVETITSNNGKLVYTGNSVNMVLVVSSIAVIALATTFVVRKRTAKVEA